MARARTKSAESAASQDAPESTSANGVTKMDAVRDALKSLGNKAKPSKILDYIQSHFGMTMSPQMVSNYKTNILKGGRKKSGKRGRGRPAGARAAVTSVASGRAGGKEEVKMADLRAVKDLVDRLGAGQVKRLIDFLS